MSDELFIPRPDDARRVASLLVPDPLVGEPAGLFFAAPRRTGKSTFLRRDLRPLLEQDGKLVVYVDLWADRSVDPGKLITSVLADALREHDGPLARLRRTSPVNRIGGLGFSVELKQSGEWSGTISDALEDLALASGNDVAFLVDEAQQALESPAGLDAMFALKAARDAVNQGTGSSQLYLVMTGSNRDKLSALVHDRKAPFYGARVRDFPQLGRDYTSTIAERLNARLRPEAQVSVDALDEAFDRLGRRPEMLNDCLRDLMLQSADLSGDEALRDLVDKRQKQREQAILSELSALPDLQQAILRRMAEDGIEFAPFTRKTLEALAEITGGGLPSTGSVQNALSDMREREIVWRPSRGQYMLDDGDLAQAIRNGLSAPRLG